MISVSLSHNDVCEHQMKHFQENFCDLLFDMLEIAVWYVNGSADQTAKKYTLMWMSFEYKIGGKMQ